GARACRPSPPDADAGRGASDCAGATTHRSGDRTACRQGPGGGRRDQAECSASTSPLRSRGGERSRKKNAPNAAQAPTAWQEEEHVNRLNQLVHPIQPPSTRRGFARQCVDRERESILRGNVVKLTRWTENFGFSLPRMAALLHLAPRTLREW